MDPCQYKLYGTSIVGRRMTKKKQAENQAETRFPNERTIRTTTTQ
jgi:hypothetical protein